MRHRKMLAVLALVATFAAGAVSASAIDTNGRDLTPAARYALRNRADMPARLVLRQSCAHAEDSLAELRLVVYEPDRAVFACVEP